MNEQDQKERQDCKVAIRYHLAMLNDNVRCEDWAEVRNLGMVIGHYAHQIELIEKRSEQEVRPDMGELRAMKVEA